MLSDHVSLQPPKMGKRSMGFFFLCVSLFLYCSSFNSLLTMAADSISPGQSLTGDQTITSKGGNFELGFFQTGNLYHEGHYYHYHYYIGIWYKKIPTRTVVWVANRETPVLDDSSQLKISEDGNLVLLRDNNTVWSTNSTSMTTNFTVAVLQDNGNFVLSDGPNSSAVIWQSFDYPADTWLPNGRFGLNKINGQKQRLTSWRSPIDPSPGPFFFEMDTDGTTQYIVWNGSQQYWTTGALEGQIISLVPEMRLNYKSNFSFEADKKGNYFTYSVYDTSTISRFVMDVTGQIKLLIWQEDLNEWNLFWSHPRPQCRFESLCGAFSFCDEKGMYCECLQGFEAKYQKEWNSSNWSGGCVRKTRLRCENNSPINGEANKFLLISNMHLPSSEEIFNGASSIDDCELACLKNCSCTAYSYHINCLIWITELTNLQAASSDTNGRDLYLRLDASELPGLSSKNGKDAGAVTRATAAAGTVALLGVVLVVIWRCRRRWVSISLKVTEGSLVAFNYRDLQIMTKNFSEKLGGGSFGSVSKGILPDSTVVAVKKLEGIRQGEKQFRSEVSTLGTVQHVNLVRLCGFCSEGNKRLLVYEFMPNGSLDSHLFQKKSEILDWKKRYQIALGTARGLAYLHEKCRDYIIHYDIKPENILLDAEFCPKVADFGMAKLLGREFSKVLTTVRGTIGYLAPEWISGLPITPKADVYSYGMMLLEIISGIRNTNGSHNGSAIYFPVWAATKLHEGDVLSIVDALLEGNVDMEELIKACKVACWCIQDNEISRPSMGQVIHILEGVLEVNIPPVPGLLKHLWENEGTEAFYSDDRDSPFATVASK